MSGFDLPVGSPIETHSITEILPYFLEFPVRLSQIRPAPTLPDPDRIQYTPIRYAAGPRQAVPSVPPPLSDLMLLDLFHPRPPVPDVRVFSVTPRSLVPQPDPTIFRLFFAEYSLVVCHSVLDYRPVAARVPDPPRLPHPLPALPRSETLLRN